MSWRRLGLVALIAVSLVGCKKKPKDTKKDTPADMAPAAMQMDAMDAMRPTADAMRPTAMRAAARPGGALVATKLEKPAGMVVLPTGKNPLSGVDIAKGFGEGWFGKGQPSGDAPTAMAPTAPAPNTATPAPMAPAPMTPAPMAPAPTAARPKPAPLPYAQYIHPDKSFGFRYPQGWKPVAKVGKYNNVPVIIVQVKKDPAHNGAGELGALAIILPKQGPNAQQSCQALIKMVKQSTPTLKTGPLKPLKNTPLLMFQATNMENNEPQISLALCGTVHGRMMFLSYFSVGKKYGNYAYGYQLGQALFTFTSDLLKK